MQSPPSALRQKCERAAIWRRAPQNARTPSKKRAGLEVKLRARDTCPAAAAAAIGCTSRWRGDLGVLEGLPAARADPSAEGEGVSAVHHRQQQRGLGAGARPGEAIAAEHAGLGAH